MELSFGASVRRRQPWTCAGAVATGGNCRVASAWLREALEHTVAKVFEIERAWISQPTRGVATVAQARQVAMYLAHIGLGMTMRDVGLLFDRDRTTVSHAVRIIEEKRDIEAFDQAMAILEEVVRQLAYCLEEGGHEI